MELLLLREYFPDGTNGDLYHLEKLICHTIELPWKNNEHEISCIPEGKYSLQKRYVAKYGWHLLVENVPDRTWILIHPAYYALTDLKGCIAPEVSDTGHGRGINSKAAFKKLLGLVFEALKKENVYLTIKKK